MNNPLSNPDTLNLNPDWPEDLSENEYDGDYRCQIGEGPDEPCHNVATQAWREPYTPNRFPVPVCDEHIDHVKGFGYAFDREATIQLARDVEREEMEAIA